MHINWRKSICGDFDRIDLSADHSSDWFHIQMTVGNTDDTVKMTLRSTEAVRDLHFALTRYLAAVDAQDDINRRR